jgi:hypothetical protein
MSLVGNLEDLGLGEILQIVSLSRRSGVLSLESRGRQARVIFRNGQVIRATSTTFEQSLGEVLIQKGVIDLTVLRRALQLQKEEGHSRLLGSIMIERFGISADAIESVVREQIENVVYSLFVWAEGVFEFDLQEVPEFDATSLDPVQFMLKQGLNPQYLAMEGSRILDELRHRGETGDERYPAPDASDDSLDLAFDLPPEAPQPENEENEFIAQWLGGAEQATPPAALDGCFDLGLVNIGDELRLELGEEPARPVADNGGDLGRSQLRSMLEELNNQHLGGGIMLLVLRYAAEFLNRAVVLMVKKESIRGLGQFGLKDGDDSADARVGTLSIPRDEPSLFAPVLESGFPWKGGADDSPWSGFFLDQLGEARPREVFVAPIVSEGKVVALLYGDNLPEEKPIGDTDSLEIFLGQAGIAMEKALLQRRLQDQGTRRDLN